MSSTQRSTRTYHRRRYPSKSPSPKKNFAPSDDCQRLQRLLKNFNDPCPKLDVIKCVGEGTFSKVYLVKDGEKKLAIKHLVPTASPDRILMEVDCLKVAEVNLLETSKSQIRSIYEVKLEILDIILVSSEL